MPSAKGSSSPSSSRRERLSGGKAPTKTKLNGWAAVATKQKEFEDRKERQEEENNKPRDFWMKAGESAVVQFLQDEPHTFDGHSIKDKRGDFKFVPCQLDKQKYCLLCREQIKTTWKAAFKVLDYRGSWDKEKKKFTWDKPVEKLWVVNMTILGQLQNQKDKRKRELSEMVLEVSRTGKGKNDTSYNFEKALNDADEIMKPIKHKETFPAVEDCIVSPSDETLVEMGFEKPDDND